MAVITRSVVIPVNNELEKEVVKKNLETSSHASSKVINELKSLPKVKVIRNCPLSGKNG
ncbi:hypothetical protein ACTQ54_03140 [Fundicoccus sp. Sow4_H7]|uniref:hypothetical protein n=1 Tax=Fundicoccus sp. Sow4_H7 TaxID=3438784 RepID=UPI003F8DC208